MQLKSLAFPALLLVASVACSSDKAPLTVAPPGPGGQSGAAGTGTTTSGTGGASNGGVSGDTAMGGTAMGATAGSGGSSAGSGGATAGSGGSGGQLNLVDVVATTPNEFGVRLADSWFLTPCYQELTFNCITIDSALGNCPASQNNFEESGAVFLETFTLGGDAATLYDITFRAVGIVEAKHYRDGVRRDGNTWFEGATPPDSDLLYTGGAPVNPDTFNVFKLSVFNTGYSGALPAGNDSPSQHFYLNSFPEQSPKFLATVPTAYQFVVAKVPGGATIEYLVQDSNCLAIQNCGSTAADEQCSAPRTVNGITLPTTYRGQPLTTFDKFSGGQQPYSAQFIHITVEDIKISAP